MKVILPEGGGMEVTKGRIRIRDLLADLHINPLEVLVARNDRIVPEDEWAEEDDEIRIINVKSGG